jgi:hypothetical protein
MGCPIRGGIVVDRVNDRSTSSRLIRIISMHIVA